MHVERKKTVAPTRTGEPVTVAGTTRFIARCLLIAGYEPRFAALFPPGSDDLLRRLLVAANDASFVGAAESRLFRTVFQAVVGFLLPGITLHYLARKRCLEDWLRSATGPSDHGNGGFQQIVVLGAGLDTLAWRSHVGRPTVQFIELDRPAALRVKEDIMAAERSRPPNLTFLAADLARENLSQALERSSVFDPALPTLFLAEGLFMYLPPERVQSLLSEITALGTAGGSKLVAFTFMETRADRRIGFRRSHPLVTWWLRRQGEPFLWSIAPDQLPAFLAQMGLRVCEVVSGDALRNRYLSPAGLREAPQATGEWLALAQTSPKP